MSDRPDTWKTTSSRKIADCRVFTVREDTSTRASDGASSNFFVIESPDWVNVVAITRNREVVLIEQFRHGSELLITEIPGGMVDEGEEAEMAAKRELAEETGYSSDRWMKIGESLPNPAIQNNAIHHFLALDCEKTGDASFDDHESIAVRLVPLRELEELVHNKTITHSLAVTALYFAQRYLKNEDPTS